MNIIRKAVITNAQSRPEVIIVPSAAEASSFLPAPSARAITEAPPTPKVCDTAMMTSVAGKEIKTERAPARGRDDRDAERADAAPDKKGIDDIIEREHKHPRHRRDREL